MSDKVWNKAMRDTTGLKAFYESNSDKYQWGERVDAEVYECGSMLLAQQTVKLIGNRFFDFYGYSKAVNESSSLNVKFRKGKFDTTKTGFISAAKSPLQNGVNEVYEYDDKYYVVVVNDKLPAGPKKFDEAKGAITSDYQNYLKKWMKEIEGNHTLLLIKKHSTLLGSKLHKSILQASLLAGLFCFALVSCGSNDTVLASVDDSELTESDARVMMKHLGYNPDSKMET